jgi:hypothetical protein
VQPGRFVVSVGVLADALLAEAAALRDDLPWERRPPRNSGP